MILATLDGHALGPDTLGKVAVSNKLIAMGFLKKRVQRARCHTGHIPAEILCTHRRQQGFDDNVIEGGRDFNGGETWWKSEILRAAVIMRLSNHL